MSGAVLQNSIQIVSTICEDWTAMEDSFKRASGLTIPHFAHGVQLWVSLIPLSLKEYNKEGQQGAILIPFLL